MSPSSNPILEPSTNPVVTLDTRWTRVRSIHGGYEWEQVRCFRFTEADGQVSWADHLTPEQQEWFRD